ncbi:hypothetical protein BJ741DRAFT_661796 [Chytriomyces cf. hyalinus JEL632]|nr:hypothetical protein BJ741DRAFT_661796 [Chytriomyces cf. hyalinus JEL632]
MGEPATLSARIREKEELISALEYQLRKALADPESAFAPMLHPPGCKDAGNHNSFLLAASPTPSKKEPSAQASSPLEGTGRSSPQSNAARQRRLDLSLDTVTSLRKCLPKPADVLE